MSAKDLSYTDSEVGFRTEGCAAMIMMYVSHDDLDGKQSNNITHFDSENKIDCS
jgi:hypothetical protein